jgi:hypothetical protein
LDRTFTGWIAPACGWRTYSITSSARASSVGGTSRPSAFAVSLEAPNEANKRRSFFHHRFATLNPRVTVKAPAGFKWVVNFAHRESPPRERYSDTVILEGLLLPDQNIRVRWWPEAAAKPEGSA